LVVRQKPDTRQSVNKDQQIVRKIFNKIIMSGEISLSPQLSCAPDSVR